MPTTKKKKSLGMDHVGCQFDETRVNQVCGSTPVCWTDVLMKDPDWTSAGHGFEVECLAKAPWLECGRDGV